MIVLLVIAAVVLFCVFYFISIYNQLTKERVMVQEGLSGIGTCLQQRNDLIPNLVETVKGYAGHENKTLVEVIKWRNQSAGATTVDEQSAAQQGLNKALLNFMSLTENYPELKANENFLRLQTELAAQEEKISYARRYYNGSVRAYNQSMAVFPKNVVGNMFGFQASAFFAEEEGAKIAPKVSFS